MSLPRVKIWRQSSENISPYLGSYGCKEAHTPNLVDGPFGHALHFDEHGRYAESQFRGIEGAKARTVAFWAKVPENFDPEQGYSMLS